MLYLNWKRVDVWAILFFAGLLAVPVGALADSMSLNPSSGLTGTFDSDLSVELTSLSGEVAHLFIAPEGPNSAFQACPEEGECMEVIGPVMMPLSWVGETIEVVGVDPGEAVHLGLTGGEAEVGWED